MEGIFKKLAFVQQKLEAPKGQYNNFGRYKYRSNEDILEALKPILDEANCALVQSDEMILLGDRYYVKATSRLIDNDNGEDVFNTAYARESLTKKGMDESQITGSCSSYARKYSLSGLLCIDDNKDVDSYNKHDNEKKQKRPSPSNPIPEGNHHGNETGGEVQGSIDDLRTSASANGSTRYGVKIGDAWYGTFSRTFGTLLQEIRDRKAEAKIQYVINGQHKDIKELYLIEVEGTLPF